MVVLERPLSKAYPEIDIVTTPAGKPVAMVHCNNCTNEINAWAGVFEGFLRAMGLEADRNRIFTAMFRSALDGEPDGGGLVLYNCLSGEPVIGLESGRPLLCRTPESALTFPNFMRTQLYSALAALRIGFEILAGEQVQIECLTGHGGFFKPPEVGQRFMAAATGTPVSVMDTAGEGGPWGMALLAAYRVWNADGQPLEEFLERQVFVSRRSVTVSPQDTEGFQVFMERYRAGLEVEREAARRLD